MSNSKVLGIAGEGSNWIEQLIPLLSVSYIKIPNRLLVDTSMCEYTIVECNESEFLLKSTSDYNWFRYESFNSVIDIAEYINNIVIDQDT
jgi:hypothetical protein